MLLPPKIEIGNRSLELPGERSLELPGERSLDLRGERILDLPGERALDLPASGIICDTHTNSYLFPLEFGCLQHSDTGGENST